MSGAVPVPGWLAVGASARLADSLRQARPPLTPPDGAGEPRPAAVLLLVGPGDAADRAGAPDGSTVLLTRRTPTLRAHAGQIAFPGGRREPGDPDAAATALREAGEEVGLQPAGVQVVAELPSVHVVPSNHRVTPVLAWWTSPSAVRPDDVEVDSVAVVPLAELAEPAHRVVVRYPGGGTWPAFDLPGDYLVWGFTAWVLDRLIEACGLDRPWDRDRVVPPPIPGIPRTEERR